jgi:capsular polysaccharide biosynthesis protein
MNKIVNFFLLIIIITFLFSIFTYYSSNKNIKNIYQNRSNIDIIINNKISNLPVLKSDTHNIIEFNSSFSEEIKTNEPRSFWNLLKIQ